MGMPTPTPNPLDYYPPPAGEIREKAEALGLRIVPGCTFNGCPIWLQGATEAQAFALTRIYEDMVRRALAL